MLARRTGITPRAAETRGWRPLAIDRRPFGALIVGLYVGDPLSEPRRVDVATAEGDDDVAFAIIEGDGAGQKRGGGDGAGGFGAEAVGLVEPAHGAAGFEVGDGDGGLNQAMEDRPVVFADVVGEQAVADA